MSASDRWADLKPRFLSAVVMVIVGAFALFEGDILWAMLLILGVAAMHWEMTRMVTPLSRQALWLSAVLAACVTGFAMGQYGFFWPMVSLVIGALVQVAFFHTHKLRAVLFSFAMMGTGLFLYELRTDFGLVFTLWIVLVVAVTDICGYFFGRIIGGPKFWTRISPKKTWSGILGGWLGAGLVTYVIFTELVHDRHLDEIILFGIVLSFASQMGDFAQSALKRATGVKDSSNIIPGHGGVFDRFDGLIGATVVFGLCAPWVL
jgi:phosphatidate cytidylyltransferase